MRPTLACCVLLLGAIQTCRARLDCESVVRSICKLNGAGIFCHPCADAAFIVCSSPRAPGEVQACEPGHHWHAFYARCQPRSSQHEQQQPEARCLPGGNLRVPAAFLLEQQEQQQQQRQDAELLAASRQDAELLAASSSTTMTSSSSSSSSGSWGGRSGWSGWAPLVGAFASKQQRTARVNVRLSMVRNPAAGAGASHTGHATYAARQLGSGAAAYVDAGLVDDEPFELFVDVSEVEDAAGGVAAAAARPRLAHPAEALALPGSSMRPAAHKEAALAELNPFGEEAAARGEVAAAAADEHSSSSSSSSSSSAVADAPADVVQRFIEEQVEAAAAPETAEEASSSQSSSSVVNSGHGGVEEFADAALVAQLNAALLELDARGRELLLVEATSSCSLSSCWPLLHMLCTYLTVQTWDAG